MKETRFIKQNKEKWSDLEGLLAEQNRNADRLSDLFVKVTDDLSYSRTFYPNRYVRVYLNHLAQRLFLDLYKNKNRSSGRFLHFWKEDLPLMVYECRRELLMSLAVFALAFGIGFLSSALDENFPRLILGDRYIDMTEEYIKSGDPMKVYKTERGLDMFLGIALNNLYVSFLVFICGLLATTGSVALLLYNGIMLGAFQYFFVERGLFRESFLTVWMHGTLEISCIVLAGAAGIVLGKGLVYPGTYTRLQSLQLSARRSLKLMAGIAPIIVAAALIESFITRYTRVPDVLRLAVIGISLFFILAYFVWYPVQKFRSGRRPVPVRLPPPVPWAPDTTSVRNNGELFGDSFMFYIKYLNRWVVSALVLALFSSTILWLIPPEGWRQTTLFHTWLHAFALQEYFDVKEPILFVVNTIAFTCNFLVVTCCLEKALHADTGPFGSFLLRQGYKALLASFLLQALFFIPYNLAGVFILLLSPVILCWLFAMIHENVNPLRAIRSIDGYVRASYSRLLGLLVLMGLAVLILFFIVDSPVLWLLVQFLQWNVLLDQDRVNAVYTVLMRGFTFFGIHVLLPLIYGSFALLYFTLKEIHEAGFLRSRIQMIRMKNGRS